ncbi:hypothetical protein [Pseudomonas chlororaphis]|nr:hypothetical protein [Pseudomonas chlororaphis]
MLIFMVFSPENIKIHPGSDAVTLSDDNAEGVENETAVPVMVIGCDPTLF